MAREGNIATYNSPIDKLNPSEIGADALAQAGRHIGVMYRQTGEDYQHAIDAVGKPVANYIDRQNYMSEVSQGAAAWAAIYNNQQTQWQQMAAKADPNDKSIQGEFLNNSLEPALQQFQSSFTTERGQQWALERADSMRTHFGEMTSADMMNRSGAAARQNATVTLNQIGGAAYKDPSGAAADAAMKHVDATMDAIISGGNWSGQQVDEFKKMAFDMKNEVAVNTVKGMADSGQTDKARALLDSGSLDGHIPANEQASLHRYIDSQSDAQSVEQKQKVDAAATQKVQVQAKETTGIFTQLSQTGSYPATQAFANDKLSLQQRRDLTAKNDGILTLPQSFLTSPAYGDNFSQIALSVYSGRTMTPEALTAGVRRQEITPAGAAQIQAIQDKMKTPEGLAEANAQSAVLQQIKTQIVKGGPNANDPQGQKIYNDMLNSFYTAWDSGIKAGKTPAQLTDPNSKDYIGNLANSFKRSDAQAIADVTAAPQAKSVLPAVDKRVAGQVYPTPRGDMQWTGTGWIAPKAQPAAQPTVPRPE